MYNIHKNLPLVIVILLSLPLLYTILYYILEENYIILHIIIYNYNNV